MQYSTLFTSLVLATTAVNAAPARTHKRRHNHAVECLNVTGAMPPNSAPIPVVSSATPLYTSVAAAAAPSSIAASSAAPVVSSDASAPSSAPSTASSTTASPPAGHGQDGSKKPLNVVYWGQNGGGLIENNDLTHYCTPDQGIDVIVLAFLYEYGTTGTIAAGTIGQSCYISAQGEGQQCDDLAKAVATCQKNGVKIVMSLGGAEGSYSLQSQEQAETIGQNLWDAWGNAGNGSVPRPFGSTFVNGWDFDIESNSGNQYYQYLIAKLRSNFAKDPSNTYWITGAPQCPLPEPNMGEIIAKAQFDYLWVQFYNNPSCSTEGPINFNDWKTNITSGPSKDAKIVIGVPASPLGATGTQSGAQYYLAPEKLASLVGQYSSDSAFGGIMMWAAAFSDANVVNGCTYAQQAHKILTTGSPC